MPRARGEAPDPNRLELSTFQIDGLTEAEVWEHGWVHFLKPPRRLHGRADFPLTAASRLAYGIDEPPPRHRILHEWPSDEQMQSLIAHDLAEAATFRSHVTPTKESVGQPYPGAR